MATKTRIHYDSPTSYKLIYIFCVHDETHKDMLKIGDASIDTDLLPEDLPANCTALNQAAKARINQYAATIGVKPHILHTELAIRTIHEEDGRLYVDSFRDYDVHKVLTNSGIDKEHPNGTNANEWFKIDIATAKNAIKAVKEGRKTLTGNEITDVSKIEIILREEQEDAIHKTIDVFKTGDQMLWNAKMRYGKTVTALSLVKRQLDKYKKTLIITHRPVVQSGWRDDFRLVFKNGECTFESKEFETDNPEESTKIDYANEVHLKQLEKNEKPFIYFASIQDLRGSKKVGGRFDKNNAVFDMNWDLIINDEAHEGTQTKLGLEVASAIKKSHTKLLSLSGTPFNIMYQYDDEAIYTWDYVMEQAKKEEWDKTHPGDPNPYASLPQMHIFTYDLGDIIRGYSPEIEGKAFNFAEFFRTWTGNPQQDGRDVAPDSIGEFVHKADIEKFLHLISTASEESDYPFSTEEYRNMFRHTLWMVPGVKEAKALSKLLRDHPIFGHGNFGIANVAGEGDDYEETHAQDALNLVKKTIRDNDYSITLSCGKLTTGVTIKEWTACFMLSGSYTTGAANYLQTIFRVQSPGSINGKAKEHCYVFDFAPDRTLRVVTEAAKVSRKGGSGGTGTDEERRKIMAQFLNFCPVIAINGTTMKSYSVDNMMQQVKHIYAERAINSGFEDSSIYNERLMALDKLDIADFEKLKGIIGQTKANKSTGDLPVNEQGFTEEQYEELQKLKSKKGKELTEEQKKALEKLKKQREDKNKAESILRGVSVRMPLLIFGADVPFSEDITIERFVELVDDESWNEFMPKGVTKSLFKKFIKYYDKDVFVAAAKGIRLKAKRADGLLPTERVQQIALIHSKFKNPDKETVLTPWRIVNLHMSEGLGGYCFYDETFLEDKKLDIPRFVDQGTTTVETLGNPNAKILEINSKTGLYPLYVAYSIYRAKCKVYEEENPEGSLTDKKQLELWAQTISENVFVICKTPMAKSITIRTLTGYNKTQVNAHYFDDIIKMLREKPKQFKEKVLRGTYWGRKDVKDMVFDAVVGNPPYQLEGVGETKAKKPIYHFFIDASKDLSIRSTLIHPARFLFNAGDTPKTWNESMLSDPHYRVIRYWADSKSIFSSVDIKGGIAITFYDKTKNVSPIGIYTTFDELNTISQKVKNNSFTPLSTIIISSFSYHFTKLMHEDHPEAASMMSKGHAFDLKSSVFERLNHIFSDQKPDDSYQYIRILGRMNNTRKYMYIRKDYINNVANIDSYKVFISKANGTGKFGETLSSIIIGEPKDGATETFLSIGNFSAKEQALFTSKYIKTKFVRALLGMLKVTQDVTPEKWKFVPLQDFSSSSDIDWTKSISDIDKQLYAKYNLTIDEINFIETHVKSMDPSVLSEYQKMIKFSYDEIVEYLLNKYGPAKHNYFKDTSCTIKNQLVTRTAEGLYCHHIDEDKAIMLSNPQFAAANPFEYQKADHLVYCNLLEHLILHVKIAENPSPDANEGEIPGIGGAVDLICKDLNDIYAGKEYQEEWRVKTAEAVKDDFDDYILALKYLWKIIDSNLEYKKFITEESLCEGHDGKIVPRVLEALNDFETDAE